MNNINPKPLVHTFTAHEYKENCLSEHQRQTSKNRASDTLRHFIVCEVSLLSVFPD